MSSFKICGFREYIDINGNKPRIWKISEAARKSNDGVPDDIKDILLKRNAVSVNALTLPLGVQKKSQGKRYMQDIKIGDYFYLCYGSEVVLLGQIISEPIPTPELDYYPDWYERSYKLIRTAISKDLYKNKKKHWTPNYNSTCVQVKENEEELFEKLILKPYFDMTLEELFSFSADKPEIEKYTKEDFLKDVYLSEQD